MTKFVYRKSEIVYKDIEIDVINPVIQRRSIPKDPGWHEFCCYCLSPIEKMPQIDILNIGFTGALHYHLDCYQKMIFEIERKLR